MWRYKIFLVHDRERETLQMDKTISIQDLIIFHSFFAHIRNHTNKFVGGTESRTVLFFFFVRDPLVLY